jgi:hypothetical protein
VKIIMQVIIVKSQLFISIAVLPLHKNLHNEKVGCELISGVLYTKNLVKHERLHPMVLLKFIFSSMHKRTLKDSFIFAFHKIKIEVIQPSLPRINALPLDSSCSSLKITSILSTFCVCSLDISCIMMEIYLPMSFPQGFFIFSLFPFSRHSTEMRAYLMHDIIPLPPMHHCVVEGRL